MSHVHIHLELDDTTAVAYISRFGGKYSDLNDLAQSIWEFVNKRHINLTCSHLQGARNTNADYASRDKYLYDKEWQLLPSIFNAIVNL